jgi:trans-2,3-dihydro-3-hydroxyanthranilate isomerase
VSTPGAAPAGAAISARATYRFFTADVFTSEAYAGNPLAVLPDARGLTTAQMTAITREFNLSETVFVLPPDESAHARRVRIFTPGRELPFAGHPTVGTAIVLATAGYLGLGDGDHRIVLEEGVGPVPVRIRVAHGVATFAQLSVARLPEVLAPAPARDAVAAALGLEPGDLAGGPDAIEIVSCGVPFVFVPLVDRAAVGRASPRLDRWDAAFAGMASNETFVFARNANGAGTNGPDVSARMFAPGIGVPEDPATGSAVAALGGYLAARDPRTTGTLRWVVAQGVEMGRPSRLELEVDREAGRITAVRVGGGAVLVSEGTIRAP